MKNKAILAELLECVVEKTELPSDKILSDDKTEDVVDARHLLIWLAKERGVYKHDIADYVGCSRRAVLYAISCFEYRMRQNKMLRAWCEMIRKQLGTD